MSDKPLRKNIVICCDGTGNEFGNENSNVVKLYTACKIDNEQVGYYNPGVGTMGAPNATTRAGKMWSRVTGLAFGAGFRDHVIDAYRYLMETYSDNGDIKTNGDLIYIFGFSRGAYAARALAGMLYAYGLLCKGNEGHIPYVWRMFTEDLEKKRKEGKSEPQLHAEFKATFSHDVRIHFIGLWDTVSAVGWITEPLRLLYSAKNPAVHIGRHAVSIDERRCFYENNLWGEPEANQDIQQVWFTGVHSDVGGSYSQNTSYLSNITLEWMLGEARAAGLLLEEQRVEMLFGRDTTKPEHPAAHLYRNPELRRVHTSLHGSWWLLELLPHKLYTRDDEKKKGAWKVPLGRSRVLPANSLVHSSAVDCLHDPGLMYAPPPPYEEQTENLRRYAPRNFDELKLSSRPDDLTDAKGRKYYVYRRGESDSAEAQPASSAAGTAAKGIGVAAAVLAGIYLLRRLL